MPPMPEGVDETASCAGSTTDGFGRSEGRRELRDFFEVDARHIVAATLSRLAREGKVKANVAAKAFRDLEIDPERPDPVTR
jgi:pyruvate dehydrogenase E1 component